MHEAYEIIYDKWEKDAYPNFQIDFTRETLENTYTTAVDENSEQILFVFVKKKHFVLCSINVLAIFLTTITVSVNVGNKFWANIVLVLNYIFPRLFKAKSNFPIKIISFFWHFLRISYSRHRFQ